MATKKYLIIVNPAAGSGRFLDKLDRIKNEFIQRGVKFDLLFTSQEKKADHITKNILRDKKFSDILILGGDGTINEVVNGLGDYSIPISVVSTGTGNDTIKHIQSKYDFESQIKTAFEGSIVQIDAGECNGRMFLNGVGIGFDGKVAERMANKSKKFHGYASYLSEVLRILLTYQEKRITALIDGTTITQEVFLMTVTKGTTFGGGFMINPYAKSNDGLLDICVVGKIPSLIRLNYVLKMKKGGHRHLRHISFYKSEEVSIKENPLLMAHMDGEVIGNPPFIIKILPRKIQFRI